MVIQIDTFNGGNLDCHLEDNMDYLRNIDYQDCSATR